MIVFIVFWVILGPEFREGTFAQIVLLIADLGVFLFLCHLVVLLIYNRHRIIEPETQRLAKSYLRVFLFFLPFYGFEVVLCATEFIKIPYHFIFTPFMLFFWNLSNLRSLLRRLAELAQTVTPIPLTASFKRFGLTKREEEVAALLVVKYSYQEIADQLAISLPTVKTHIQNIYQKMAITRRSDMKNRLEEE